MAKSIKETAHQAVKELMEINKVAYCSSDDPTEEIEYVIEYQRAFEDPIEMTKMIWYNMFNYVKKNHHGEFSDKEPVIKVHHKKKTIKLSIMMEIGV